MSRNNKAFTVVEILVVMPIVILAIGAFITVIVNMTGDVLASRSSNSLIYDIHNSLAQIEQDIKLSSSFLETTSFPFSSPQGSDDASATPFVNVSASGQALILNSVATTGNPASSNRTIVYLANNPSPCTGTENAIDQNDPVQINIVYFVKNGALWRRTIMPIGYTGAGYGCNAATKLNATIWQQASCAPSVSNPICLTKDIKLVSGIDQDTGFKIDYFSSPESTTPNSGILSTTNTVNVTISSTITVAGREIKQSGSAKVTLPN